MRRHLPQSPVGWVQLVGLLLALAGGGAGGYESVIGVPARARDRDVVDQKQWEQIHNLRVELDDLKTEIAVLKDRENRSH